MSNELRDARDPGWFHIDNAVLDRFGPLIGANGIAVYTYLVRKSRVTETGRAAWPSYATIAGAIGVSRPTAIGAVRTLEQHGLIRIQMVKEDGKRPYNRYTIVKVPDQPAAPVNEVDQSTGKAVLPVKNPAPTGKGFLPVMVKDFDSIKTQVSRHRDQERELGGDAVADPSRTRASDDGDGVSIPPDLSPGEEERAQMQALGIPPGWYGTKWWSIVEHYENKPSDRRTVEKWRWTCRHLISEDWAKVQAQQAQQSSSRGLSRSRGP